MSPLALPTRHGQRYPRRVFATPHDLADALAEGIATRLRDALVSRGGASLVVSGGRTPEALFTRLAAMPLDWSAVTVTLADERWVPPTDTASNEALVRRSLLTGPAAQARFVGLYTGHASPEAGEDACNTRVGALSRPFDVVLLGMGEDGHTASLFPGSCGLAAALSPSPCQAVQAVRAPGLGHPRMTLTLPTLLDSRSVLLVITGAGKLRTLDQAEAGGPVEVMPVRALLRQDRVLVDINWAPETANEGAPA